ncbi:hypothetical protein ACH5RR_008892 [Cinchona calisaya]|uniref:Uncharacterized protein n=1 Tax=Cinchona calisaya TaxID=153742 RepID=A0ABD3AG87_9GENT
MATQLEENEMALAKMQEKQEIELTQIVYQESLQTSAADDMTHEAGQLVEPLEVKQSDLNLVKAKLNTLDDASGASSSNLLLEGINQFFPYLSSECFGNFLYLCWQITIK